MMDKIKTRIKTSKFLSLILRHNPRAIDIELDENGWANVDELLAGMNRNGSSITLYDLQGIVATDDKQRYSFSPDGANQGHSISVDLGLKPALPPDLLYHGTIEANKGLIKKTGIKRMQRQYVHLSKDVETAVRVGNRRHGETIICIIDAKKMREDGVVFYHSANGVWLTDFVDPKYIRWEY